MVHVISLDWLQLYVDVSNKKDTTKFKEKKSERGTQQYERMSYYSYGVEDFAVLCYDPLSGILKKGTGILKLDNRTLYSSDCKALILDFLTDSNISVIGLTRCDICADFNFFANRLNPHTLIDKFAKCEFLKVGQGKFKLIGSQAFKCVYEYLSFGTNKSPIRAYLYDKTKELVQVQEKPYIRDLWRANGIDDQYKVWRMEFSVKSQGNTLVDTETGEIERISWLSLFDQVYLSELFYSLQLKYFRLVVNDGKASKQRMKSIDLFNRENRRFERIKLPALTGSNQQDKVFIKRLHTINQVLRRPSTEREEASNILINEVVHDLGLKDFYLKNNEFWNEQTVRHY